MRYLPLVLVGVCCLAQAEIYKTYDKNGNVVFTDTPSGSAEKVQEKQIMTMPALSREVIDKKKAKTEQPAKAPAGYKISVEKLKAGDVFRHTDPEFGVIIQLEPVLWKGHHLQVAIDDSPLGQDMFFPVIKPAELGRGQHRLEMKVVDAQNVVLSTESLDFFVQQPSAIKPKKP